MKRFAAAGLLVAFALAGCPKGSSPIGPPDDAGVVGQCQPSFRECTPGVCVDTSSDRNNCGECGRACEADEPFCVGGECGDCGALASCGEQCVSLDSDPEHCGTCDRACGGDAPNCEGGECVALCANGSDPCEGACPDFLGDPLHCGGCGVACTAEQRCEGGVCVSDDICPGQMLCDGRCTDRPCVCGSPTETACEVGDDVAVCANLAEDEAHCGACGNACSEQQDCVDGHCVAECPDGTTRCGGVCANLHTDPAFCGSCERSCSPGQVCADEQCVDGVPVECDSCPCAECPDQEEPAQSCCELEDQVLCLAAPECPEEL